MQETILILDESPAQLASLQLVVEAKLRYRAITTSNPEQALNLILASAIKQPDLLLLDLGKEPEKLLRLVQVIRQKLPDFPIIILTEYGAHEPASKAIEAGATDFLTKPLATARMGLSISNAFRMRNLQKTIGRLQNKLLEDGVIKNNNFPAAASIPTPIDSQGKMKKLRVIEEEAITYALDRCGNSMSKAARMLGIGRSTLYRKVSEIGRSHIFRENQTTRPTITSSSLDFS